jgi:energy-coupling factor transporter ATP-binding protein EcfA2
VVKLKRLKINRYRDVEPCELRFSDRFNVLLGPNGAGKTTLLELISKVLSSNPATIGDPFAIDITITLDNHTLTGMLESAPEDQGGNEKLPPEMFPLGISHGGSGRRSQAVNLSLHMERSSDARTLDLKSTAEAIQLLPKGGPPTPLPLTVLSAPAGALGALSWVGILFLDGQTAPILSHFRNAVRFDEALDVYRAIVGRQDDPGLIRSELRPKLIWAKRSLQTVPATFAEISGLTPQFVEDLFPKRLNEDGTAVTLKLNDLPFLSKSVALLDLRSALAKCELTGRQVEDRLGEDISEFGNLKFWFTQADGSVFQDQHLSYGQKRLLAFLYYIDCNPSFVVADELVNGLHHAWIEECVTAIGDRQAFLTSQNPLLLDYLSFDSIEQVKETFILCRPRNDGSRKRMIWRNMTDDEADMFYRAYKVGIEHVGEILRTRGLW